MTFAKDIMPVGDITFDESYFRGALVGYGDYPPDLWDWDALSDTTAGRALSKGRDLTGVDFLIIGCAFGYLVEMFRAKGYFAWGVDISEYAIANAAPGAAPFVGVADVRDEAALDAFKQGAMGMRRQDRIPFIMTDDVMPCLDDKDAVAADFACRGQGHRVAHRVSTHSLNYLGMPGAPFYNSAGRLPDEKGNCQLRTLAEWRQLLGGNVNAGPWIWQYQTFEEV